MASSDWGPVDSNTDALPHGATAPDLFGGELFGDELMDMYNSAAVVEHEMTDNEIPSLLGRKTHLESHRESNHPGAFAAISAAGIDDGFGAFRPSTSFNDLASLFHPETVNSTGAIVPLAMQTPAPVTKEASKKTSGRKRAAVDPNGPATKKRGGGSKVRPASSAPGRRATAKAGKTAAARTTAAKAGPQSAGHTALKLRKEQRALLNARAAKGTNETPNPLSASSGPRAAWLTKAPIRVSSVAGNSSVALPVVVSPRTSGGGKGDSITSEAATAAAAAVAAAAAAAGMAPIKVVSANVATEADFKSVAQAAVTNLILNAGSQKPDTGPKACTESDAFTGKIDTSTEHIKALTSSNWVNACGSGADDDTASIGASGADAKANNRARRQNLTPDERARQNRDRNREHARNTRLRKKAYVEELKRTLTELVSQRDAAELDKRHAAQREMEQREVRFRVMEEFLKLRGRSETNLARWVAILEDNFSLTLPETDYRRTVHVRNDATREQLLRGANEVMTDASYVASLLSTLLQEPNPKTTVSLLYHCERKNCFMDDSVTVLDWTATVVGAHNQECAAKLSFKGIMRAKFSPASNKLVSAELIFDSGRVASQLATAKAHTSETADRCDEVAADAAAQAAANEADALLDSLQMPHLNAVPAAITVMAHSTATKEAVSVTCSEKEDASSDESTTENVGVAARRSTRLKD